MSNTVKKLSQCTRHSFGLRAILSVQKQAAIDRMVNTAKRTDMNGCHPVFQSGGARSITLSNPEEPKFQLHQPMSATAMGSTRALPCRVRMICPASIRRSPSRANESSICV